MARGRPAARCRRPAAGRRGDGARWSPASRRTARRRRAGVVPVRDPPLAPHLVDDGPRHLGNRLTLSPDAGQLVEVVAQRRDRQVLVDVLADAVRRLDGERQARDDTQGTQRDHRPRERLAVSRPAERDELAVAPDQLHRHDGGGQVPQPVAGPVRRGRAGAGHRDVGQRGQVVEREAGSLEAGPKLAVPDRAVDRDGPRRGGRCRSRRGSPASEMWSPCVSASPLNAWRDPITRMERRRPDRVLDGLDRRRLEEPPRAVLEVAGPVPPRGWRHHLREHGGLRRPGRGRAIALGSGRYPAPRPRRPGARRARRAAPGRAW